jgi:hypothetical protein
VQVGDLVRYYPGMLNETHYGELGIVIEEVDADGVVVVQWPDYPTQHELEFVLERVNESR